MPKNKGKGGKNRKRGVNKNDPVKRQLVQKDDNQEYGQVSRMLGNGRCKLLCLDGVERLGIIRGKMRKKVWVNAGDVVLVGLRDYQDEKADIIGKYRPDEVEQLVRTGQVPETFGASMKDAGGDDEGLIRFAEEIDPDAEEDVDEMEKRARRREALGINTVGGVGQSKMIDCVSSSEEDEEEEEEEEEEEDEDDEEEESEDEPEEPVWRPKVKDKRQVRAERKAATKSEPSSTTWAAPAKGGKASSAEAEVDIDDL